ncbi:hypothetical protein CEW87_06100 [Parazoarcus communis]|uniref:Uncharacterized protein n=1 Tax=Parazoarcus communis TaxID=41977 RepID=A0A2U8GZ50_9RHOO|nr:hypothetical protein CEW87_06100 [Parazoarcus communis]
MDTNGLRFSGALARAERSKQLNDRHCIGLADDIVSEWQSRTSDLASFDAARVASGAVSAILGG